MDKASLLIAELLNKKLMDAFAKCLFFDYNVMLVNANGTTGSLDNFLSAFKNHKVLFCCGVVVGLPKSCLDPSPTQISTKVNFFSFIGIKIYIYTNIVFNFVPC